MEKFRRYLVLPSRLSRYALKKKLVGELRIFVMAKLEGHRANISELFAKYNINEKTGRRAIQKILAHGWAESDGKYIFPKSWARMPRLDIKKNEDIIGYKRSASKEVRQEYLESKEKFLAHVVASALHGFLKEKAYIRKTKKAALEKPAELGTAFSCGYYSKALGIPERTFKTYKALAQSYGFLNREKQRFTVVGHAKNFAQLRSNMKGVSLFIRGHNVVHPEITPITVNLL